MEKVDIFNIYVVWSHNARRAEIQNTFHSRFNELVCGSLGAFRRGCDNPKLDTQFGDFFLQALGAKNFQSVSDFADFERVAVKILGGSIKHGLSFQLR